MMCIPRSCDYNVNVRHVRPPLSRVRVLGAYIEHVFIHAKHVITTSAHARAI